MKGEKSEELDERNKKKTTHNRKAALTREDARRKCGELVGIENECERDEGRENVNEMERGDGGK